MTTPPKRLIEFSLPLKAISAQSVREKSIRHGHISTLHIWWARRPLTAMRAAVVVSVGVAKLVSLLAQNKVPVSLSA